MRLITPYAPPTFLKPVLVVSTVYTSQEQETAILFVLALNAHHALEALSQTSQAEFAQILAAITRGLDQLTSVERAECARMLIGLAFSFCGDGFRKLQAITPHRTWRTDFIVIRKHGSREEAIAYHLDRTKNFINGGSEEEWSQGWDDYLELYDQFCPEAMRDPTEPLLKDVQKHSGEEPHA